MLAEGAIVTRFLPRWEVLLFDIRSLCFKHQSHNSSSYSFNFLNFYFYTFTDLFPKRIKIVAVFVCNPFRFCNIFWLLYRLWSDHHSSDVVVFVTKWTAVHSNVWKDWILVFVRSFSRREGIQVVSKGVQSVSKFLFTINSTSQ